MFFRVTLSFLFCMLSSQLSFAAEEIAQCLKTAEDAKVGTKCKTSVGVIFERVQLLNSADLAWRDTVAKFNWLDGVENNLSNKEAEAFCRDRKASIPGVFTFKMSEIHKFREILKSLTGNVEWEDRSAPWFRGRLFWTYNAYDSDGFKKIFSGKTGGEVPPYSKDQSHPQIFAICVN